MKRLAARCFAGLLILSPLTVISDSRPADSGKCCWLWFKASVCRPSKTAIWRKWKRKYGLRSEKDEEMWIKILQKKMWKKLRREEAALPLRNCHQIPPN
ncbi:SWI/SNF related, matrix associated, actin dependent regulator of chromatin, subfamily a, member 2 [Homo sapiens]|uniref:SWI/SNF related, matrix associated, actin dependent regulator of chromatin, subfamily a, member 2 n=1 Tax=Homo sapiens TaxID=9606 RepID=A0A0U1RQP3_HUMAN|nr:SWI/SNF related, matrix associated, actin dependent regulator of chromatin, subfamily a, member 2 [Homo sapiens]KAI2551995.1 SWI/SNF related, matrix associated, actin dependent regulator of chromatin, subfamily a, member 2 [Homo sapiens]KAI2551996.1 SWI/SNF related, matrix associated, actin dependent regulator of chromatin, subfamily a, member 2 [Homo sapiens]KAI4006520.1 SWI/SNF related, matrix associated, actin dependent regulator of chromatin, subfamily a, member 2 [Homo sapiens]KAI400652